MTCNHAKILEMEDGRTVIFVVMNVGNIFVYLAASLSISSIIEENSLFASNIKQTFHYL